MNWYAVTVRPRHEFSAAEALAARDVVAYVPSYKSRRQWTDRMKTVEWPLIPGYVFVQFDRGSRTAVLQSNGVTSLVQLGGQPAPIPDLEIESLRTLLASGYPLEPVPGLVPGERIRVENGPLAGAVGVFLKRRGADCMAVTVELLGRSVIATVNLSSISRE